MDKNQGYEIIQAVMLENGRGFALGHNPAAPSPYVTWACYLHYGQWLGENQKLSQKEQIRLAIDAALTERPKDFADFLRRMETAGIQVKHGRGGVISFLVPGQQRAARFRASTLGDGYGPEDVQAVIDGKAPTRTATARKAPAPRRVNLLIDIQERMRQGKGPAYQPFHSGLRNHDGNFSGIQCRVRFFHGKV